jgi:hypothetical protein
MTIDAIEIDPKVFDVITGVEELAFHELIVQDATSFGYFRKLDNLRSLELEVNGMADLQPLSEMSKLTVLRLVSCGELTSLSGIEELSFLDELHIEDCEDLKDLTSIEVLDLLRFLCLRGHHAVDLKSCDWAFERIVDVNILGSRVPLIDGFAGLQPAESVRWTDKVIDDAWSIDDIDSPDGSSKDGFVADHFDGVHFDSRFWQIVPYGWDDPNLG